MSPAIERLRGRLPFPEGTIGIGAGLVVLGLTSYGFLVITGRVLGPSRLAPLSALWAIVFTAGPGVFLPFEQEVSRLVSSRTARGIGSRPIVRRVAVLAGALAVIAASAAALTGPITVPHLFGEQGLLVIGLIAAIVGYAAEHVVRGVLAGTGHFGRYGAVLATEGILRVAAAGVLAALGVAVAGPYGIALGAAPLLGVVAAVRRGGWTEEGPSAGGWGDLSGALGWLLTGSVLSQGLANAPLLAGPIIATPPEDALVGAFLASFVVARVPLFAFSAVQSALLPHLAKLAGVGDHVRFRSSLGRLLRLVAWIGVSATVVAWLAGPWIVRSLFGPEFPLGRADLAVLTGATGAYMIALALAQALIALGSHARAAAGFALGVAAVVVAMLVPNDVLVRLEVGFLTGAVVAAVAMGVATVRRMPAAA